MLINLQKIQTISNLFCIFQFVIYIYYLITFNSIFLFVLSGCFFVNLFILFLLNKRYYKLDFFWILFFILFFVIFASLSPSEYILKYKLLLLGLSSFCVAIIFQGVSAIKYLFYINIIFNIIVFYFGWVSGFDPSFGNNLLENSSRNIVSACLLFGLIYYLFFCFIYNKKINLILSFFVFINCLILFGRSGLFIAALLLLYSLYKRYGNLFFLSFIFIFIFIFSLIFDFILSATGFSQGLDTPRSLFFKEYLFNFNFNEIVFGRSINKCCSLIFAYDSNPHNSFIYGHMQYGILHTLFFIFIFIFIVLSRKIELIFFVSVLYIRYSLDVLGLFNFFDVVLFSIFIYGYQLVLNRDNIMVLKGS